MKERTVRGQVNHLNCDMSQAPYQAATTAGGMGWHDNHSRRVRGSQPAAAQHSSASLPGSTSQQHCASSTCVWQLQARQGCSAPVPTHPPRKPSHVFLGDSLMSGVRPKKKPAQRGHSGRACEEGSLCSSKKERER